MFQTRGEAPLRGTSTPDKPFGFHDATVDGGWQVPGEPYVNTSQEESGRFDWWRSRMLGGRTNHWGRISLPQRALRFQTARARRAGIRLADHLRGARAVLRQGRDADRRLWRQRRPGEHAGFPDGLPAAAAEAARQRSADRAAGQETRHSGGCRASSRAHADARFQEHCRESCIPAIRRRRGSSPST